MFACMHYLSSLDVYEYLLSEANPIYFTANVIQILTVKINIDCRKYMIFSLLFQRLPKKIRLRNRQEKSFLSFTYTCSPPTVLRLRYSLSRLLTPMNTVEWKP